MDGLDGVLRDIEKDRKRRDEQRSINKRVR